MHVTLSDGSDGRAVLYYGKGMIFFTAFVSIQGLYPRVPAHHFLCEKWGFGSCFPRAKPSLKGPPSLFDQTKTISLIGNHFW